MVTCAGSGQSSQHHRGPHRQQLRPLAGTAGRPRAAPDPAHLPGYSYQVTHYVKQL